MQVLDTVEDKGLEAVASHCPLLEELRVFPADPSDPDVVLGENIGVTDAGFIAVSRGCPKLHYVLYFCRQMTNAAVATVVQNCPNFTHFRLCILKPCQPDYTTNEPMDEAFGSVVKRCTNLTRLSVSGLLTDLAFEYIGKYAKNLEFLSLAFVGSSDKSMQCLMSGCPKIRQFDLANREVMDESAEWRLKYDQELQKSNVCAKELAEIQKIWGFSTFASKLGN
ncbi:protein AUXIN SIGNALING F-BOX 2-like [Papaver somniferum]|uniref:protein AUXIN SIGNALING F-BOX 2-like n=1 Tax=Papaver somniferum TaxID=3469 RepID=UPI000E6F56A5|nr:protein AUXIN SIGNALING F-BOX 2-like [Papaver somniferum]